VVNWIATPLGVVQTFKRDELPGGFKGMLTDNQADNLLLVVRDDKNVNSVKYLVGKCLLSLENYELAEVFIDSLFLKQFKSSYIKKFATVQNKTQGSRILLDIYFNKADDGMVYRNAYNVMVEINPEIGRTVLVLEKLPTNNKNFSYFVKGYPFAKELSKMAVIAFKHSARAKQILDVFRKPEPKHCSISNSMLNFFA